MSSPIMFFKEVRQEMQYVSWPTKKETIRLTAIVIGVSLAVGAFIGLLDFSFTNLLSLIFK